MGVFSETHHSSRNQCFGNGDEAGCQNRKHSTHETFHQDAVDTDFLVADERWKDIAGGLQLKLLADCWMCFHVATLVVLQFRLGRAGEGPSK